MELREVDASAATALAVRTFERCFEIGPTLLIRSDDDQGYPRRRQNMLYNRLAGFIFINLRKSLRLVHMFRAALLHYTFQ
jgi:hypothetical protein